MQLGQMLNNPYSANIITAAFTPQTLVKSELDVEHMVIYDTIHLDPGDTVNENTTSFFTDVGPQSGKSLAQTNLDLSQQLPTPEAFSIQAIGLRWFETIDETDLFNLLINTAFEFLMGGKRYAIGPLTYYVPGGGVAFTATDLFGNGLPGRIQGHRLAIPIVLDTTSQFKGRLVGTSFALGTALSGGTGLRLQCLLDGYWARGVR